MVDLNYTQMPQNNFSTLFTSPYSTGKITNDFAFGNQERNFNFSIGGGAGIGSRLVDAFNKSREGGIMSNVSGYGKWMSAGAMLGSAIMPGIGTAVGALLGAGGKKLADKVTNKNAKQPEALVPEVNSNSETDINNQVNNINLPQNSLTSSLNDVSREAAMNRIMGGGSSVINNFNSNLSSFKPMSSLQTFKSLVNVQGLKGI